MLIIIEGADKTGKTTLARRIEKELGYEYVHFGPPGKDPAKEYAEFLINLKTPVVCDRFYYGELVYGPLLRQGSVITSLQQTTIERLLRLRGAILVHARTPLDIVRHRLRIMGDDMITAKQNEEAYRRFESVLWYSTLPKYKFEGVDENSCIDFINLIRVKIRLQLDSARKSINIATGVGTAYGPEAVLVGDTLNKNTTWLGLPFDGGPCSMYLNDCIKQSFVEDSDIYFVNSDTLTQDEATYLNYPWTKFVALGAKASKRLTRLGIEHKSIPHPQYWRRFHSKEQERYISMLEGASL